MSPWVMGAGLRRQPRRIATLLVGLVLMAAGVTSCESAITPRAASSATSVAAPSSTAGGSVRSAPTSSREQKPPPLTAAPADRQQAGDVSAVALLARLPVKGRAPMTGYSRGMFGPAWTDDNNDPLGHNGCDTRNDILRRDLTHAAIKPGSNGCTVLSGTLADPYTATTIAFVRGRGTSSQVQVDHVVALGDAWQTGAQQWGTARRVDLANDPLNLLAVAGSANQHKGDADAATWLPPNRFYRCAYVARQVAVKARYALWVTPAEHDAIAGVLSRCANQSAPAESGTPGPVQPMPPTRPASTTHPALPPSRTTTAPPPRPAEVYYTNCAAVRAAGKAPLYRGQPGYRDGLDRDHDGVACE